MKAFIIVLSLVAASQSLLIGNNNVEVTDDGVVIDDVQGRQYIINRPGGSWVGRRNVQISVSGPRGPTKKIEIVDRVQVRGPSVERLIEEYPRSEYGQTVDVLGNILNEYQGLVSAQEYEQLLARVGAAVQRGYISGTIYNILQSLRPVGYPQELSQEYQPVNYLRRSYPQYYQQNVGQGVVDQTLYGGVLPYSRVGYVPTTQRLPLVQQLNQVELPIGQVVENQVRGQSQNQQLIDLLRGQVQQQQLQSVLPQNVVSSGVWGQVPQWVRQSVLQQNVQPDVVGVQQVRGVGQRGLYSPWGTNTLLHRGGLGQQVGVNVPQVYAY